MIVIDSILDLASTVIARIWPDATQVEKDKYAQALQESLQQFQLDNGQLLINQAEASNENVWVSGWRPFCGWIAGFGFAWQYVFQPMITYFLVVFGVHIPPLPILDTAMLSTLLFGLLGLGTLRTVEKVNNARK